MNDNVGNQLQGALKMLFQDGGENAGLFLGGKRIQLAADAFEAGQDMVGLTLFSALKDGMLDEMRDAAAAILFIPRTGIYVDCNMGDRALRGNMQEPQAVMKCFDLKLHPPENEAQR